MKTALTRAIPIAVLLMVVTQTSFAAPIGGIETDPAPTTTTATAATPDERFRFAHGRTRLIQFVLRDKTDAQAEVYDENDWILTPREEVKLRGNAFALENTLDGSGTVFLKLAPLPDARAKGSDFDVRATKNGALELNDSDGYLWKTAPYQDRMWGRIAAFHDLQRQIRPYDPAQDGLFTTNTWGDRNRDAHLNARFMSAEIDAGARLGADIVQIDDGWQQGTTANSAKGRGVWNGFWASDPNFWQVNATRFPDGLKPLADQARARQMNLGLWFAPDSSDQAANWERDADALLTLHRDLGVNFFKFDALKIDGPQSETNFGLLLDKVRRESNNEVNFDLDITAEKRFGYFGQIEPGRVFLENRYSDWGSYWPHLTLRSVWNLSHVVDPVRLRIEWLNNARNDDKYPNDPLAPSKYRPDALFATTMMCSPLGWFETQNLPESYFVEAAPLVQTWKSHREAMQRGTVLPVGSAPDGGAWTGFVSVNAARTGGYALLFRELNPSSEFSLSVPFVGKLNAPVGKLGGDGNATLENGVLKVQVPDPLRFIWVKF